MKSKIILRTPFIFLSVAVMLLVVDSVSAATLWFRPGAIENPAPGTSYSWNSTDLSWNTALTGVGVPQTWADHNIAGLKASSPTDSYGIQLDIDVTVEGFLTNGSMGSGQGITISGTSARTITFLAGATITNTFGTSSRFLTFGNNIALSGDFSILGTGNTVIAGAPYSGTVTIGNGTTGGRLGLVNNTSTTVNTKVKMENAASILTVSGTATIGELSGTSGTVARDASDSRLIVDQSTTTSFGGVLDQTTFTLQKDNIGTLVLNGTGAHTNRAIIVNGGSLYARGNMTAPVNANNNITVAAGANFGGVSNLGGKYVILSAASSALTPGMFNTVTNTQEIGTLTLGLGSDINRSLTASEGGTFNFAVGLDGNDDLLHSQIVLPTDGLMTLGTDKVFTINLIDLGVADLANGAYAISLFHANTVPANFATFEGQWQLNSGSLPSNWDVAVDPFSVSGNDILFSFNVVPEPSAASLLVVTTMLVLGKLARRSRFQNRL